MKNIDKQKTFLSGGFVLALDVVLSIAASLLAVLLVRSVSEPFAALNVFILRWEILSLIGSVVGFSVMGTYNVVILHSTYRTIGKQVGAIVIKEAFILAYLMFAPHRLSWEGRIENLIIVLDGLLTLVMAIGFRVLIIMIYQTMLKSPEENIDRLSVMIFGTGYKSIAMLSRFELSPHYNPIGFITTDKGEQGKEINDRKVYYAGTREDLQSLQSRVGVEGILFASEEDARELGRETISECISLGIHVLMAPKVGELKLSAAPEATSKAQSEEQAGTYIPDGMSTFEVIVKRFVDCALAGGLLFVFSPLFLYCYLAIKKEDDGPVIYSQERIGRFGRPFRIYKFRTMRTDAEKAGPALFAGEEDTRITRIGKHLRAHHLDELPQLWNVFIGDMAFVGPRPERKFYIDQIMEKDPRYYFLYQIRPGVTSYATFFNGYCDTVDKMVRRLEYDLYYLRNRSWWFDIKILWKTFTNIVGGKKF